MHIEKDLPLPRWFNRTQRDITLILMLLTLPLSMSADEAHAFSCDTNDSSASFIEVCTGETDTILVEDSVSGSEQEKTYTVEFIGPFTASSDAKFSGNLEVSAPKASSSSKKDAHSINAATIVIDGEGSTLTINNGSDLDIAFVSATGGDGHKGQTNNATAGKRGGHGSSITGSVSVVVEDLNLNNAVAGTGFFASAIGGNGGTGGSAESDGTADAGGGNGGSGGSIVGSVVVTARDLDMTGTLTNGGFAAFAKGGDGGKGGDAFSLTGKASAGDGGAGGSVLDTVLVSLEGVTIDLTLTSEALQPGIWVGAYGGNGGKAGSSQIFASFEAPAADGGDGGTVGSAQLVLGSDSSPVDLAIDTAAAGISAIAVYSEGGNAGNGNSSNAEKGGKGGTGGDAGSAGLMIYGNSTASISTNADSAIGVDIGSTGGSGGNGGDGGSKSNSGNGGSGGDAGQVSIAVNAISIETKGETSIGLRAQSVGGAGGDGHEYDGGNIAYDGGNGGDSGLSGSVDAAFTTVQVLTHGSQSPGLLFASTGGAAGLGLDGGKDGDASSGSTVFVTIGDGTITTNGELSHAILARSTSASGYLGGDGGRVEIVSGAAITVNGGQARGIYAQSVGGVSRFASNVAVAGGSNAIRNGNAEDVLVVNTGAISVAGAAGAGIYAESLSTLRSGVSEKQTSGRVFVETSGDILVSGESSAGIDARSIGYDSSGGVEVIVRADMTVTGASAAGVIAESTAEDQNGDLLVVINSDGSISVDETGGDAIRLLQGDQNVIVNSGLIARPDDGALSGYAITTSGAGVTVENEGTITGSILLESDGNDFDNFVTVTTDGTFNTGAVLTLADLGARVGRFQNYGVLSPGGPGVIQTTTFQGGTFQQFDTGTFEIDLNMGGFGVASEADVIQAAQSSFVLDGSASVTLSGSNLLTETEIGSAEIVRVADGEIDIDNLTPVDTVAVDYSVSTQEVNKQIVIGGVIYDSYTAVNLEYAIDLTGGLDELGYADSVGFAEFWQTVVRAVGESSPERSGDWTDVSAVNNLLMSAASTDDLQAIYDSYIVDEAAAGPNSAIYGLLEFTDALQSCPRLRDDPSALLLRQRECGWIRGSGRYTSRSESATGSDYDERAFGVAGGLQRAIGNDLFVELGANYENLTLTGGNYSQDGDRYQFAGALKKELWPLTLSATVSGGFYTLDYDRQYLTGLGRHTASADIDGRYLAGEARASYVFEMPKVYIKPIGAVSVVQTWQDSFTEQGSGPLNWSVASISELDVLVRAMLEIGSAFDINGAPAVAFVRPGVTGFLTDPDIDVAAMLTRFPGGTVPSTFEADRVRFELALGLEMDMASDWTLELQANAAVSANAQTGGGWAELRRNF